MYANKKWKTVPSTVEMNVPSLNTTKKDIV